MKSNDTCYESLIYYKNGEKLSFWATNYIWVVECSIRFRNCGYAVEIWEYNEQGSRLLERNIHEN